MKFSTRFLVLSLVCAGLSSSAALYGAAPLGERGGKLTAAEEAQQKLLRQLRRDIAIHRILSRQNSAPVKRSIPSVARTAQASTKTMTTKLAKLPANGTCSSTVDSCFSKLESLFEEHFGEEFQITQSVTGEEERTQAGI